jgi:hypothetical protein
MRKIFFALTAALLVSALIVSGCGKTAPKKSDAQKLLEESNKKMQTVKSFKAVGTINMSGKAPGAGNMDLDFEMQVQTKGPRDFDGHMVMKGMGQDTEMYMVGGNAYVNVPGKGWYKQPLGDYTDISKPPTPAEMAKISEAAENVRILTEDSQYYRMAFDVGPEYIEEAMGMQKDTEGLSAEEKKMMEEMLKGIKMTAVFKIEKSTMYILNMTMGFGIPNMPLVGAVRMEQKIDFSEFDKPVSISLPEEAKNAPEVTPGSEGLPTTPINP